MSNSHDRRLVPSTKPHRCRYDAFAVVILREVDVHVRQRLVGRPPVEISAMRGPLNDLKRCGCRPATSLSEKAVAFVFVADDSCDVPLDVIEILPYGLLTAKQCCKRRSVSKSDRSETRSIEAMTNSFSMLGARRPDSIWRSSLSGRPHSSASNSCVSPLRVRSAWILNPTMRQYWVSSSRPFRDRPSALVL